MEETESQTKRDMLRLRDYDTLRSRYGEQYGNIPTEAELRKYVNTKKKMKKKGVSNMNQSAMKSLMNSLTIFIKDFNKVTHFRLFIFFIKFTIYSKL